jgi:hypothetical protein
MNVKLDSYLFTEPSLGLPVLEIIFLILNLIAAVNYLLEVFMTNGKKATVVPGGIGDD